MSKFKSFASQGSFRDYQLQAPDETAKIREETARTIRGKERAQAFLEKNQALYLQAQKQAQQLEAQNRETNFRLETENRKAFIDQKNQEADLAMAALKQEAEARQRDLENITQFSKTAFELYNTIDQTITKKQTEANTINTYRAGTTYGENLAILGLEDNLSRAEFEQQDYVRKLVNEGKDSEALWGLYRARKTRGYLNNQAVAQNTAYAYDEGARKTLYDLPADATAEQRKIALQTYTNNYVGKLFTDTEGRQLSAKFLNGTVLNTIRKAETALFGQIEQFGAKERAAELERDTFTYLNNSFAQKGVSGLIEWYTANPGKSKRDLLAKWVSNKGLDTSRTGMSDVDINEMLDYQYEGPNGPTTIREQWGGSDFYGALNEAKNAAYRARTTEYARDKANQEFEAEATLAEMWNRFTVDGDGQLSDDEYAQMTEVMERAPLDFSSKTYDYAGTQTVNARTAAQLNVRFEAKANAGTLTPEEVLSVKGNYKLTEKWLPIAEKIQGWKTEGTSYDTDIAAIKAKISDDARVAVGKVAGTKNFTVLLMQDKFVRKYDEILSQTGGDHGQARGLTLGLIDAMQQQPGAVVDGNYTEIMNQVNSETESGKELLSGMSQALTNLTEVAKDPDFATNPKKVLDAVGSAAFFNGYDNMQEGKPANAAIKAGAALMGVTPLEFMNYIAPAANYQPITADSRIEMIQSQFQPITRRARNIYRTPERGTRANLVDFKQQLPVRGTMSSGMRGLANLVSSGEGSSTSMYPSENYPQMLDMSIAEVVEFQKEKLKDGRASAAVGSYQFLYPEVAAQRAGLSLDEKFTPENQFKMFVGTVLNKPGRENLSAYLQGKGDKVELAIDELAQEFASIDYRNGRSYYNDAFNKSTISRDQVRAALMSARQEFINQ